jgi:heme/copper-type cytochrome/quinol oxidase subunit 4
MNQLLPGAFFAWCHDSAIGEWINDSVWAFAIIETFHIIALTVLLGTIIALDLHLLGIRTRRQSTRELARELAPYTAGALLLLIVTGVPMFMSQAIRYSQSVSFLVKMLLLVLTITFHFTVYRHATRAEGKSATYGKLVASLSLACWLGVALAGRGIAFLP